MAALRVLEADVRSWVKKLFGDDVSWVEPSFGSSVGLADCQIPSKFGPIPIELKLWKVTKFGLKQEMRPAQIRYHIMSSLRGVKTAILFGTPHTGIRNPLKFYLIRGADCPKEHYCSSGLHWWCGDVNDTSRKRVETILNDEKFWGKE